MARKRMISPEIWQSEDFSKLSTLAKLVFIGLFSNADDEGRGRARAVYIKSIVLPYEEGIRVADIEKSLDEIAANMSVIFYAHDGNEYYELTNWQAWQKVDKPQKSKVPAYDTEHSEIVRGIVGEASPNVRRTIPPNRIEENRKEKKGTEENIDSSAQAENPTQKSKTNKPEKVPLAEFVTMTNDEYASLIEKYGESDTKRLIEILDNYKGSSGKKYKSDYRAVLSWVADKLQEEKAKHPQGFGDRPEYDELAEIAMRKVMDGGQ